MENDASPRRSLLFRRSNREDGGGWTVKLKIRNCQDHPIRFGVKVKECRKYRCRPERGILEPGGRAKLRVEKDFDQKCDASDELSLSIDEMHKFRDRWKILRISEERFKLEDDDFESQSQAGNSDDQHFHHHHHHWESSDDDTDDFLSAIDEFDDDAIPERRNQSHRGKSGDDDHQFHQRKPVSSPAGSGKSDPGTDDLRKRNKFGKIDDQERNLSAGRRLEFEEHDGEHRVTHSDDHEVHHSRKIHDGKVNQDRRTHSDDHEVHQGSKIHDGEVHQDRRTHSDDHEVHQGRKIHDGKVHKDRRTHSDDHEVHQDRRSQQDRRSPHDDKVHEDRRNNGADEVRRDQSPHQNEVHQDRKRHDDHELRQDEVYPYNLGSRHDDTINQDCRSHQDRRSHPDAEYHQDQRRSGDDNVHQDRRSLQCRRSPHIDEVFQDQGSKGGDIVHQDQSHQDDAKHQDRKSHDDHELGQDEVHQEQGRNYHDDKVLQDLRSYDDNYEVHKNNKIETEIAQDNRGQNEVCQDHRSQNIVQNEVPQDHITRNDVKNDIPQDPGNYRDDLHQDLRNQYEVLQDRKRKMQNDQDTTLSQNINEYDDSNDMDDQQPRKRKNDNQESNLSEARNQSDDEIVEHYHQCCGKHIARVHHKGSHQTFVYVLCDCPGGPHVQKSVEKHHQFTGLNSDENHHPSSLFRGDEFRNGKYSTGDSFKAGASTVEENFVSPPQSSRRFEKSSKISGPERLEPIQESPGEFDSNLRTNSGIGRKRDENQLEIPTKHIRRGDKTPNISDSETPASTQESPKIDRNLRTNSRIADRRTDENQSEIITRFIRRSENIPPQRTDENSSTSQNLELLQNISNRQTEAEKVNQDTRSTIRNVSVMVQNQNIFQKIILIILLLVLAILICFMIFLIFFENLWHRHRHVSPFHSFTRLCCYFLFLDNCD